MLLDIVKHFLFAYNKKINSKYLQIGDSINTGILIRTDVPVENRKLVFVGDKSVVGGHFIFESEKGEIHVGNNTFIGGCTLICRSKISIGNYVQIAWGSYLYDHNAHSTDLRQRREDIVREFQSLRSGQNDTANKDWKIVKSHPIVIEDDAWIGMNVIILNGVTIGRGAVVGAGSVVRRSVPPYSVVMGNPARVVKFLYNVDEIENLQRNYYTDNRYHITKIEYEKIINSYLNREV